MKKIIQTVVAVMVIANMTGCATTKGYFVDRGRDAADILTVTMSAGLGARARVGPIHAGLNATIGDIGLRTGVIELDSSRNACNPFTSMELLCTGYEFFWPQDIILGNELRSQTKTYFTYYNESFPFLTRSLAVYDEKKESKISDNSFKNMISNPYLTQIEAQASFLVGIRLGFNIGELADFLLGWIGIDIYGDDFEAMYRTPEGKVRKRAEEERLRKETEQQERSRVILDSWKDEYYEQERKKRLKEKSNQSSEVTPKPGAPQ